MSENGKPNRLKRNKPLWQKIGKVIGCDDGTSPSQFTILLAGKQNNFQQMKTIEIAKKSSEILKGLNNPRLFSENELKQLKSPENTVYFKPQFFLDLRFLANNGFISKEVWGKYNFNKDLCEIYFAYVALKRKIIEKSSVKDAMLKTER